MPNLRSLSQGPQDHHRAVSPLDTHWRPATCKEVDCPDYLHGWSTIVPDPSPQSEYIRHRSGRRYLESSKQGIVTFKFFHGQRCFDQHKLKLERDPILVKNRQLMEGTQWMDNLSEGLYRREQTLRKGDIADG